MIYNTKGSNSIKKNKMELQSNSSHTEYIAGTYSYSDDK